MINYLPYDITHLTIGLYKVTISFKYNGKVFWREINKEAVEEEEVKEGGDQNKKGGKGKDGKGAPAWRDRPRA